MSTNYRGPLAAASIFSLAVMLAACGGGGGGGGTTPPTSPTAPGSSPTASPSSSPTSNPTESASGTLALNGVDLANAKVTFTCGCSQSAGLTSTDANGNYTVTQSAPAAPKGTGTYTLQGHNVLVIGYSPTSSTQVWTLDFVGNTPATDLNLSASDTAATAAALYLYYEVAYNPAINTGSNPDRTFDWFNFNTVNAWVTHLRSGTGLTSAETTLLSDIASAQSAGTSLFPYSQNWNPTSDGTNAKIASDLSAVASGGISADDTLPTPCPGIGQCSGAPTP